MTGSGDPTGFPGSANVAKISPVLIVVLNGNNLVLVLAFTWPWLGSIKGQRWFEEQQGFVGSPAKTRDYEKVVCLAAFKVWWPYQSWASSTLGPRSDT